LSENPDFDRRLIMPILLGIILGVILTIGGAYEYDTVTGRAPNGLTATAADGRAPMVNWDIVTGDWRNISAGMHKTSDDLQRLVKPHTG
jgi:hypothetical protein